MKLRDPARPTRTSRRVLLVLAEALAVFGASSAIYAARPGTGDALSWIVLVAVLAGLVLLFPFMASSLSHLATAGRSPILASHLVAPAVQVLTIQVAIAPVPIFGVGPLGGAILMGAAIALLVWLWRGSGR